MRGSPRVIFDKDTLLQNYQQLDQGDIICGKIPLRPREEHLLLDLVSRGVRLIPSARAQIASRSKVFQARIFGPWMVPETAAVYDLQQLLELTNRYHQKNINHVILKQEGKNAGIGVLLYGSIEDVYNQAATGLLVFPFVVQPYIQDCLDLRVILLGNYQEAYRRINPNNFRNNLHWGGTAEHCDLSDDAKKVCLEVMHRGDFPYGHFDLLEEKDGRIYLSEVSLRGGIRGARISTEEYRERVAVIEQQLLADLAG